MFHCKCNHEIFWQTNKLLTNAMLVFKMFSLFFLPRAGLQINIECARKLLNYSWLNFLSVAAKDNLLEFTYLPESNAFFVGREEVFSMFVLPTCQ